MQMLVRILSTCCFVSILLLPGVRALAQEPSPSEIPSFEKGSVEDLIAKVKDKNQSRMVRGMAASTLSRRGKEAEKQLIELLSHPDRDVSEYAASALEQMDSKDARDAVADYEAHILKAEGKSSKK